MSKSVKQFSITWVEANARRLERHGLAAPLRGASPVDAVRAMCGAHAQILAAGELSIGLRLENATRVDVRKALWEEHSLIKTFGPRGTVHLLPADDLALWTGALSALPSASSPFPEAARMTEAQTDAVIAAIGDALADAELTVDELSAEVVARAGAWAGDLVMPAFQTMWPRWRQAISTAAHRGVLCFGPNHGRNITYTNPRRWLPDLKPRDGQTALAEFLEHYLHAYGPATPSHFAQWLNVSRAWATKLFESLGDRLQQVELENAPAWIVAGDTALPADAASGVRLLPYFDAFVVGSHPRDLLFPGAARERALARGQAGNFPVVLVDGVAAGVWHQHRSGRKIAITVEPLMKFTAAQRRDLDTQVQRVGRILEGAPELTIGRVSVGPHA